MLYCEFRIKKKDTYNSSVKSNIQEYKEAEVNDDLAFRYYKKKVGANNVEEEEYNLVCLF